MKYFSSWYPFVIGWAALLASNHFAQVGLLNGTLQLVLFALLVCLPVWRTGRLNYVDLGWPWGIVVVALVTLLMFEPQGARGWLVGLAYLVIGLRMALMATYGLASGAFRREFPRYQYQRLRWEKSGKQNVGLALQTEALMQAWVNASLLAYPAFLMAWNPEPSLALLEVLGLLMWLAAFLIESTADAQKMKFLTASRARNEKQAVCNVGLWRYSRHPNYFGQWMGWNGLIVAAIPSWLALYGAEHTVVWVLLGVGLAFFSYIMYNCLVYYSGAVPAEYYSLQKRPAYKAYQQQTNRFFPGPMRGQK